jgi:HAD superfamily hydrolase (TIGR01509 family)
MDSTFIKGVVIFDCDGVMFDSKTANINFYNHILAKYGMPPMKDEDIAFVHMHTADASIRHILRGSPFLDDALRYRFEVDYRPFLKDMVMEPGLKELLACLRPAFRLAVATNRSNTIGDVLDAHGLRGYFDKVVSSLDVSNPKPHPECLLKIIDHFNLPPKAALYIGDSQIDEGSARAAGVPFVSYKNRSLDADYHVDHLMQVLAITGNPSGDPACARPWKKSDARL